MNKNKYLFKNFSISFQTFLLVELELFCQTVFSIRTQISTFFFSDFYTNIIYNSTQGKNEEN